MESVRHGGQQVEQCHRSQVLHRQSDHPVSALSCHKHCGQRGLEQSHHPADQHPIRGFHPKAHRKSASNAVLPARAAVLGNVGGNALGNALFGDAGKIVNARHRIERSDHFHTQGIHLPLDEHFADWLHGLLQSGYPAILQRAAQQAAVNAPLAPPGAEFRRFGPQPPPGQHGAERFGNHRCHGGAYNAKAQPADKDQVQRCVQNGRYHQKAQRRSGIAHTFEPRRQRIVKAGERCPQKGNAQIDGRDRKNLLRNRTGLQNRRGE